MQTPSKLSVKHRSLQHDLWVVSLFLMAVLTLVFIYFGFRVFDFYKEKSSLVLKQESLRIQNAFDYSFAATSDTMEQLNKLISKEKLTAPQILNLFHTYRIEDNHKNLLSWNMFSWVTGDKTLTVNSRRGVLSAPIDVSSREYVQHMLESPWKAVISPVPLIGMVSGQYIITCAMGATGDNNEFAGGIVIGFALDEINKRIQKLIESPSIDYALLSPRNLLVIESKRKGRWALNSTFIKSLNILKSQKVKEGRIPISNAYGLSGEYVFFQLPYSDYIMVMRNNPDLAFSELMDSLLPRLLEIALVMSCIPLLFWWGRKRIVDPILTLTGVIQKLSQGKIPENIPHFTTSELESLSTQLTKVVDYVTEKKITEEQLIQKTEMAENAARAKSDFMSCITHELRTPLNAILGYASVQQKSLYGPLGNEKYYDYVKDIQAAGSHLLGLIDTILDYIRAEEGVVQLRYEEIDLIKLLHEAISVTLDIVEDKRLNIIVEADSNIPHLVSDRFRLKQVIINILSNSAKFMQKDHQIVVNLKQYRDEKTKTRQLLLLISDSGRGIHEDDIARIIKPFSQIESGLDRRYGGIGLGLPLSQKLIEILGGSLIIESTLGYGTTVILQFPENLISPHRRLYQPV